jgi:hypothetical protein
MGLEAVELVVIDIVVVVAEVDSIVEFVVEAVRIVELW